MAQLGWAWVPTMHIGQGCEAHLRDGELYVVRTFWTVGLAI
jgi:hypothetical protein